MFVKSLPYFERYILKFITHLLNCFVCLKGMSNGCMCPEFTWEGHCKILLVVSSFIVLCLISLCHSLPLNWNVSISARLDGQWAFQILFNKVWLFQWWRFELRSWFLDSWGHAPSFSLCHLSIFTLLVSKFYNRITKHRQQVSVNAFSFLFSVLKEQNLILCLT